MLHSRKTATVLAGIAIASLSSLPACSASSKDTGARNGPGGSAGAGFGGASSFAGAGTYDTGGVDGVINVGGAGPDPSAGGGGGSDGSCGIVQKPEQVIQYSPVAIYLMQDISSSMVGTLGDPQSWPNSLSAVTAFVQDQASTGLDVGLAVFPAGAAACDGTDCGKPVVEIGPLPQNAQALVAGMKASTPPVCCNFTPTECALNGMIKHCQDWTAKTGEKCVAVLVTDGEPSTCDLNASNLAQIVATGYNGGQGVTTFTIGLPGSNKAFLDQLAQAGGSTASVDVSAGSAAFIAALNAIRGQVAVGTALPCNWTIPPPKDGQTFDPAKVNLAYTAAGAASVDFGYVAQVDCARATNAWYFDDPNKPTQVIACPTTCEMLKASQGSEISVSFGCARKPAPLR